MNEYDPKQIEPKWQAEWEKSGIYEASEKGKPKWYSLIEFPYPSGAGLHTGHVRSYTAMDVLSRKRRMEGFDVLYPIGWDAFGLYAETYALKTGVHPAITTKTNTDNFRRQLKVLGMSFDWSREVDTTDPKYYKWTQWLFLQFYKHGLAYKAKMPINWCPKDRIVLANEEVIDGKCERCGTAVEKRDKEQWMLAITKYADRLDKDLDDVDYPERVKAQQRNWIGRSEGAEIDFELTSGEKITVFTTRPDTLFGATFLAVAPQVAKDLAGKDFGITADSDKENKEKVGVDTGLRAKNPANGEEIPIWVVNYVSADYGTGAIMGVPAHDERDFEFARKYGLPMKQVILPTLIDETNPPRKDKQNSQREIILAIVYDPKTEKYLCLKWKTQPWTTFITGGIEAGEDPVTAAKREILEETGYREVRLSRILGGRIESHFYAAHKDINRHVQNQTILFELVSDERDTVSKEESDNYDVVWLSRREIESTHMQHASFDIFWKRIMTGIDSYSGEGMLVNSNEFDGLRSEDARWKITEKFGRKKITFKLRDWIFARQRYWGEPIPVVHCSTCGIVPLPEDELPLLLPEVERYEPTDTGESPLAKIDSWVDTTCPKCGGAAKRETDTMPQWAGSSWYFLRYTDPHNDKEFASKDALEHWMPVDWYNGGMEHTTLHLLYSRFWNKFFFDLGLVPTSEPYKKRTSHGLILAEGGVKMSKSLGNVVNPDSIVERLGADTLRVYEMFMGPFEQAIAWSDDSLVGPRRFLEKVWKLSNKVDKGLVLDADSQGITIMHQTIKKVSDDIETLGFNTAVSSMMVWINALEKRERISKEEFETFLKLLAPFAPHITEELWKKSGNDSSIHTAAWPAYDASRLVSNIITIVVQVNGKSRGTFSAEAGMGEMEVVDKAINLPEVQKWVNGKEIKKKIYVKGKLVNVVVS